MSCLHISLMALHVVEPNAERNSQLSEGDRVIISSNLNLADGSEVRLKE